MTNVTKLNLDHIADDIRQVMEVHNAEGRRIGGLEQSRGHERGGADNTDILPEPPVVADPSAPRFDLAAEIRKETERAYPVRDAALQRRLDLLQADLTQAMMDFGISPVVDRIVAARNDALVKGAAW